MLEVSQHSATTFQEIAHFLVQARSLLQQEGDRLE